MAQKQNGGSPPGTVNGLRTGVWANLFTKEEVEWAAQHTWDDLTAEIEVIRIRLRRMLVAEARQLNHDGQMTDTELEEIVTEVYKTRSGKQIGNLLERKKFRRTDFTNSFNILMARLESITKTQNDIWKSRQDPGDDAKDVPITTIRVEVVGAKPIAPEPEQLEAPGGE
jgi:hypothetical protein